MSKTQQKKARKYRARLFRELAALHRRRVALDTFMAELCEEKARRLANRDILQGDIGRTPR